MPRIRVLVVDDSVVIRRLVSDTLGQDAEIEVVGVAPNGRLALQKIPQLGPDLVTLDVDMPEMDGLATLREIREHHPTLPVIMLSTLTSDGASTTVEALAAGASDHVAKPSGVGAGGVGEAIRQLRESLIPRVKALCRRVMEGAAVGAGTRRPGGVGARGPGGTLATHGGSAGEGGGAPVVPVEVVCVGASTGGPNALAEVFDGFPRAFPVPVVVVQHMPPVFTGLLAERLSAMGSLPFAEGRDGEELRPGHAYLAPGGKHMELVKSGSGVRLTLHAGPVEHSCRPSVDVLFRSVSGIYGPGTLGVVLTGMGQDGTRGCEWIRERGGRVLVQDEASSVVWGMPGSVAGAGLADLVVPLADLRGEILRRVAAGRRATVAGEAHS